MPATRCASSCPASRRGSGRSGDVVVDEGDLAPSVQAGQRQSQVALRAQIRRPTPLRALNCRCEVWTGKTVGPCLGDRHHQTPGSRGLGHALSHLLYLGLPAAEHDQQDVQHRRQVDGRLKEGCRARGRHDDRVEAPLQDFTDGAGILDTSRARCPCDSVAQLSLSRSTPTPWLGDHSKRRDLGFWRSGDPVSLATMGTLTNMANSPPGNVGEVTFVLLADTGIGQASHRAVYALVKMPLQMVSVRLSLNGLRSRAR